MKEYCRYVVIDMKTGNGIIVGHKYKDFSVMKPICIFRSFPFFGRKIREYGRIKNISGKTCYIAYWVGEKDKREVCSVVRIKELDVFLRGHRYVDEKMNLSLFLLTLDLPEAGD